MNQGRFQGHNTNKIMVNREKKGEVERYKQQIKRKSMEARKVYHNNDYSSLILPVSIKYVYKADIIRLLLFELKLEPDSNTDRVVEG